MRAQTWSLPDNIEGLIGRKKVDFSFLKEGTQIPAELHESFAQANNGETPARGASVAVKLFIQDKVYSAKLYNYNSKNTKGNSLTLRYDKSEHLPDIFKQVFLNSHTYINERKKKNDGNFILIPDEFAEYVDFIKTDTPFEYRLNLITNHRLSSELPELKPGLAGNAETLPKSDTEPKKTPYRLDDLVRLTGLPAEEIGKMLRGLERKGQTIIFGPPGTGKTFVAENLARFIVSQGEGFVDLVQFHPAYSYEDFIEGIRPVSLDDGSLAYPNLPGRFLNFCEKAETHKGNCVLIIDEINRANLARVFGELMYLLEYRKKSLSLASGTVFKIPENVYIIGTMNTADRSIALVDHALRRRFAFYKLKPDYGRLLTFHPEGSPGWELSKLMIPILEDVNEKIANSNYEIGISFFLKADLEKHIGEIWQLEIEPYIEEYFYDSPDTAKKFSWDNVSRKLQK